MILIIIINYVCLIDSDDTSVGTEELSRIPKDGIAFLFYYIVHILYINSLTHNLAYYKIMFLSQKSKQKN